VSKKLLTDTGDRFYLSSADAEGLARQIKNPEWGGAGLFALVEGLLRLKQIEPNRVNLPDIKRVL